MTPLISRLFAGTADLFAMQALIQSMRLAGQVVYPTATDLYEELIDADVQITARLWEDGERRLTGFAYVSQYQNLVDVFRSTERTPGVENEMIEWVIASVQRRNRARGVTFDLDASALESDLPRQAFLERNGFVRQTDTTMLFARSLELPLTEPRLPPGFTIRPMLGEAEIEAYVELHRHAFGTENMTLSSRRAIMSAPSYLPELDLVAVAPDGSLAAFCVCQIFPDDAARAGGRQEGWTDPVGTHPDYRRLGLASALILTGTRLLKARGVDTALLGTSSQNTAMQRTAEGVGFHKVSNTLWYKKLVD